MIHELSVRVLPQVAAQQGALRDYLQKEKGIDGRAVKHIRILKRSIDARQRQVFVNLTLRVYVGEEPQDEEYEHIEYHDVSDARAVVVVGAGPGGLFAALRLIEHGLRPIVIERGKDVHERKKDLARIKREQAVDAESNYCFGEGGAGAYSDGKLYTRSKKRGSVDKILRVFCQHGAPLNILADAHPHIGTDKLPGVIEAMRNTIIRCGGEVHFQTKMQEMVLHGNRIVDVLVCRTNADASKEQTTLSSIVKGNKLTHGTQTDQGTWSFSLPLILATGHSARDVYRYLSSLPHEGGLEAKGIAVGVRLEHPSELIDQIQYHSRQGRGKYLPAAEYSFVTQVDGRGVYSFCMCPGGYVIPAATDSEQLVVNGMSPSSRGGRWSNSGMVVEIRPEDIPSLLKEDEATNATAIGGQGALRMMHFQEQLEKTCWQQGGMKQTAPAQRMADFCNGKLSYDLPQSSYAPGLVSSPLHFWMPKGIAGRLQQGFRDFGRKSRGFLTNDACLIATETRTSAPVRICRDHETLQHVTIEGLFPCGEGAGFAGGIVSAGIDGERCADMVAAKLG